MVSGLDRPRLPERGQTLISQADERKCSSSSPGSTDGFPVSRFYRGARYGTLCGGITETLRDLIGKRVLAGVDPVDGIFGLGAS
jgi:hypothetical protein